MNYYLAFGPEWFAKHQRGLLWLLRWRLFRWCLRIDCAREIIEIRPHCYTVWLGEERYQTDFRTHWKYSKRLYYAFKPLWWTLHFWDWLIADRFSPRLSFGFATLTVSPSSGSSSSNGVDGFVTRSGVNETWATIIAGAGTSNSPTIQLSISLQASTTTDQFQLLRRVSMNFYTAPLTSNAIIQSAVLSVSTIAGNSDAAGWAPSANVYGCTPASNTVLTTADFQTAFDSIAKCDTALPYASLPAVDSYWDFTLNAAGVAWISRTGFSAFGIRNNYDVTAIAPTPWASATSTSFAFNAADSNPGIGDPKLVVTFLGSNMFPKPKNIRPRPFSPGLAR